VKAHPVVSAALALLLVAGVTFAMNYKIESARVQRRQEICEASRRQYDTLHRLIAEIGKPSPQGSAIDRLVIPPGTPPQVVSILAQLSTTANPPDPHALDRFYRVLDGRPVCTR